MTVIYTPKDGEQPDENNIYRPDQLRRERSGAATKLPRRAGRRADLVCRRQKGRPALVGAVYPQDAPLQALRVRTRRYSTPLGNPPEIDCPCGARHVLDGVALVAAVRDSPMPARGRIPSIDVAGVSSDVGH